MNYAVIWTKAALDQLAEAWVNASDRTAVQQAFNRVDRLLGHDPLAVGESRSGNDRLLFEPPLAAYYRVDEPKRQVFVLSVALTQTS